MTFERQRGVMVASPRYQCGVGLPPQAVKTISSAIAEGPRDALSQLKSCQLLHNCTKTYI